jgi:A/G-specific adenine glycosylase
VAARFCSPSPRLRGEGRRERQGWGGTAPASRPAKPAATREASSADGAAAGRIPSAPRSRSISSVVVPPSRRAAIRRRLLSWWDAGHRDLPWRYPQDAADPYRVWIAEVMLQQTQVAVVVPYYARFVARFPTLAALAAAAEDEVLAAWSGLGYYARGRRLRDAARATLERHGGLPADRDALLALPGFGPYTAGAVASIAFALRSPCVDGNVARVLARLFLVDGPPEARATRERLWGIAADLVPPERPGDFNQALMELGATVCGKPSPRCERCPVAALCSARREGKAGEIPRARRRAEPRRVVLACAAVRRDGALLVARRSPGGLFGGLWELPSAEVPEGGDARVALRDEAVRRFALRLAPGDETAVVERTLTHRRLVLRAFACPPPRSLASPALRYVRAEELRALGLPAAMRRLAEAVLAATARAAGAPGR